MIKELKVLRNRPSSELNGAETRVLCANLPAQKLDSWDVGLYGRPLEPQLLHVRLDGGCTRQYLQGFYLPWNDIYAHMGHYSRMTNAWRDRPSYSKPKYSRYQTPDEPKTSNALVSPLPLYPDFTTGVEFDSSNAKRKRLNDGEEVSSKCNPFKCYARDCTADYVWGAPCQREFTQVDEKYFNHLWHEHTRVVVANTASRMGDAQRTDGGPAGPGCLINFDKRIDQLYTGFGRRAISSSFIFIPGFSLWYRSTRIRQ
ncbi:hypothetical protein DFP72DRAFT_857682 [Ephemerocybe angulata]|uniref:Uncharacterized protein n=1 Tax=Ephemerocybe angulata TaxID=980116 RepID=A0A8H6HDF9_9AGAR|nr:hypothetical protein DFP72DRAFT_857682 [Tulosesus angulatus]